MIHTHPLVSSCGTPRPYQAFLIPYYTLSQTYPVLYRQCWATLTFLFLWAQSHASLMVSTLAPGVEILLMVPEVFEGPLGGDPCSLFSGTCRVPPSSALTSALNAAVRTQWSSTVPLWLSFAQDVRLPSSSGALSKPLTPHPALVSSLGNDNDRRYLTGRK